MRAVTAATAAVSLGVMGCVLVSVSGAAAANASARKSHAGRLRSLLSHDSPKALPGAGTHPESIVTLYAVPTDAQWSTVEASAPAVAGAIVNICDAEGNGPGCNNTDWTSKNTDWDATVAGLTAAGITPLIYVTTDNGADAIATLETELSQAKSWWGITTPMFDQMTGTEGTADNGSDICTDGGADISCESYYEQLYNYAISNGAQAVMFNPGSFFDITPAFMYGPYEILQGFEGGETTLTAPTTAPAPSWVDNYGQFQFSATIANDSLSAQSELPGDISDAMTDQHAGFIYENDESEPNPDYGTLPSWFSTFLTDLNDASLPGPGAVFAPLGPERVMDTRSGIGVAKAPVGAGKTVSLKVAGVDGVPSSGVTAVVLNVTATGATANSYVTVYPDGKARPGTSNLNFTKGETIPNLVTVPVGADGKVDFYNVAGSVNLVADLSGYYTGSGSGSLLGSLGPVRVMDTRSGIGVAKAPVGAGKTVSLQVTGADGVPAAGVTAVVLNVTATGPTANSYVIVYPDGKTRPGTSNLNFTKGETIANLVVVPVGADGKVDFYNVAGSVNLVADLSGNYSAAGAGFAPLGPVRVMDTRSGIGVVKAPVGAGKTVSLQVTGVDGVPSSGVTAVVLNVTATGATAGGYVIVYPDGEARPGTSNLNFSKAETIPNLVVVPVDADGKVDFYNAAGSVNLVADLSGYYQAYS